MEKKKYYELANVHKIHTNNKKKYARKEKKSIGSRQTTRFNLTT